MRKPILVVSSLLILLVMSPATNGVAHDFVAPAVVVADAGGSFSFVAVFTYGPGGGYFAADFVDCSRNLRGTPGCWMTGDGFCLHHVEEGTTFSYDLDGHLEDPTRPGRVTIEHSTSCPDDPDPGSHAVTTIILPHGYLDSPAVLGLHGGRFAVVLEWSVLNGDLWQGGWAGVVPFQTDDSGLFWFFGADNWELMVKVLDGCEINDHYWVFASAASDVGFTLSVVDTHAELVRGYRNPAHNVPPALTDTAAFPSCP